MTKIEMCGPCRRRHDAWLFYTAPAPVTITIGAAYDGTAAGVRDRSRARGQDRRDLIRRQQQMIRDGCANGLHCSD